MTPLPLTGNDLWRITEINAKIKGWSDWRQYAFFKSALDHLPAMRDVLMLGVYQGRDVAYILDLCARYHSGRALRIVGVDKFSDTPCDDWPKERRGLNWDKAGFGEAPSKDRAWINLHDFLNLVREQVNVTLIESTDSAYLETTVHDFDFVYVDTSHDYETVKRQLAQVPRIAREASLLAGDDYSDAGTWGVKRAVTEAFTDHRVFANWIWHAQKSDLKPQPVTVTT